MTLDEAMHLGRQHHLAGQLAEAEAVYRQVLAAAPNHPDALHLVGVIAGQVGRLDLAITLIRRSTQFNPNNPAAWNDLSVFQKDSGQLEESVESARRAIALQSNYTAAYSNLAAALIERGEFPEAITAAHKAIELSPDYPDALANLASALRATGNYPDAINALRSAIQARPDNADLHLNLGWLLLLTGDFKNGWAELELRSAASGAHNLATQNWIQSRWTGDDISGKPILLHPEQGLGDTLQFIRYVPLIGVRAGRVIVRCQPELVRLLTDCVAPHIIQSTADPLPAFDVHCPLTSLPAIFATDLDSIPPMNPPLQPPADILQIWQNRVGPRTTRLRVGLAWKGGSIHKGHLRRNIEPKDLALLSGLNEIEFFNLQMTPGLDEANAIRNLPLIDHTQTIEDFADTAALIAQLDLVITVDTSVAHLAGAMGKPTWLMLPSLADWRWLLNRDDSPWYPSMRLFRQTSAKDWTGVINRVCKGLQELASTP